MNTLLMLAEHAVVAALFEIEEFAAFIIGDVCDGLNVILEQCCDEQLGGDDKCFDVTASLLPRFWVLGLAACLLFFFGLGLLKVAQQAMRERQEGGEGEREKEGEAASAGGGGGCVASNRDHEGGECGHDDAHYDDDNTAPAVAATTAAVSPRPCYYIHRYADWVSGYVVNAGLFLQLIRFHHRDS